MIEDWSITPPLLGLATAHLPDATFKAQVGQSPALIVPPMGVLLLLLVILGAATGRDNEEIEISARWSERENRGRFSAASDFLRPSPD